MNPIRKTVPELPDSRCEPTASKVFPIEPDLETSNLRQSTEVMGGPIPPALEQLLENLSAEEQEQAEAALQFLGSVRHSFKNHRQPEGTPSLVSPDSRLPFLLDSALPDRIGNYGIVKSIGRGGFAEVFLARDELLDRQVALKVPLMFSVRDDAFRLRFEREARAAAILTHPQIVPVYEFGHVGPIAFIAYAWIDGPDLATWLLEASKAVRGQAARCQLDLREAAEVVASLAQAIQHAHQRGLIHRDLKPSNILVANDPEHCQLPLHQRLRITDFGLAIHFDDSQALTTEGSVIGTPAYMSPEQAEGQRQITYAADVWALGVMLYELLLGQTPFARTSRQATLDAIRFEEPPPMSRQRADVPSDLRAICFKCLSKSPSGRYRSAGELADDLHAWLQGRTVSARPVSKWVKLNRWSKRNRGLATSLAVTFLTLAIATAITTWKWSDAWRNLQLVQTERVRIHHNLDLMSEMVNKLLDSWESNDFEDELTDAQKNTLAEVLKIEEQILAENRSHPGLQQSLIRSYLRVGELRSAIGEHEKAIENSHKACQILAAMAVGDQPVTRDDLLNWLELQFLECNARLQLGQAELAHQRVDEIEKRFDKERKRLDQPSEDYYALKLDYFRGQSLLQLNQPVKALTEFQKVASWLNQRQAEDLAEPIQRIAARSLISQANAEHRMSHYTDAYQTIRQAIERLDLLHTEKPGNFTLAHHLAKAHYQAACTLAIINAWSNVEGHLQKAVGLLEQLMIDHGRRDGVVHSAVSTYSFLARTQWKLGSRELALATNRLVEDLFRPPFDESMMMQRVWVQNAVDRVSWLKLTGQTAEASQLAQEVHAQATLWLTDFPNDIGAQQSLFAAQVACLESLTDEPSHERFDRLLSDIMAQAERLSGIKPNRETQFWIWQSQQKALKLKAQRAAQDGEIETVMSTIETMVSIPLSSVGQRRFKAAHFFAQLLNDNDNDNDNDDDNEWYKRLSVAEQEAAAKWILDHLEQASTEIDLLSQHLGMKCWEFLAEHPRFIALKTR